MVHKWLECLRKYLSSTDTTMVGWTISIELRSIGIKHKIIFWSSSFEEFHRVLIHNYYGPSSSSIASIAHPLSTPCRPLFQPLEYLQNIWIVILFVDHCRRKQYFRNYVSLLSFGCTGMSSWIVDGWLLVQTKNSCFDTKISFLKEYNCKCQVHQSARNTTRKHWSFFCCLSFFCTIQLSFFVS